MQTGSEAPIQQERAGQDGCTVAVVMPAFDAARFLPSSLPPLVKAADGRRVVVVDAGSTDDTAAVAASLGAHVIRLPARAGPAEARNVGVAETGADVILFIDADCVVHPDTLHRVQAAFDGSPDLVSLTGSYDSSPPDPGFFSQYMNLRHHFFHQRARREGATFWAGCGAVRRRSFLEVGGFDADRFPRPQIEDIELGHRLRRVGSTRLEPDLQVTHLKRWTLRGVVTADLRDRAIPWARLILETGDMPRDLNLGWSQRLAAATAPFALAAIPVIPWAVASDRAWLVAAACLALGAALALNLGLFLNFWRHRGPGFAIGALLFHQLHLIYGATTFALLATRQAFSRGRGRGAS